MDFDVLIRNGVVIDGSGAPGFAADVGIQKDRIAAVGKLGESGAAQVIDANGMVVCPGFIDVHVHSEVQLADPLNTTRYGSVLQGVTTHLTAPDGFGWAPIGPEPFTGLWESTLFSHGISEAQGDYTSPESYLECFAGNSPVNIVPQVPHCAVRFAAMGWSDRSATDDELEVMRRYTRQWFEAGAVALCLGLDYQPSAFADTRELVELSRVAREYGGIYAAHVRYNDLGTVGAWRETMAIGEQAGIPVHISHESVTEVTAPLLEEAANRCDLSFESYLYPAGCTHLALSLPIWAQAGGPAGIRTRLKDPVVAARIKESLARKLAPALPNERPVFVHTQSGKYVGLSLAEAAQEAQMDVGDFALKVLAEEDPYALMVYHRGWSEEVTEQTIKDTIQHPSMMVASDGIYHGVSGHPRSFGTFARVLRLCVREMGATSIEAAVHKMSGFPAARFGIRDRGQIKVGNAADVVVFDPAEVTDRSTWEQPFLPPEGIPWVLVNGSPVVNRGEITSALPGMVLGL